MEWEDSYIVAVIVVIAAVWNRKSNSIKGIIVDTTDLPLFSYFGWISITKRHERKK